MQKRKISPDMIRVLVDEGLSAQEIADRVGWSVGTLRVRCSQLKISLRRPYVPCGSGSGFRPVAAPRYIDGYLGKRAGNGPPQNDRTGRPLRRGSRQGSG